MNSSLILLALSLSLIFSGCRHDSPEREKGDPMSNKSIEQVMQVHTAEWMNLPGVVGVGIGEFDGKPCIKIFASKSTPELTRAVGDSVDGFRVAVQVTGEFKAHGDSAR